MSTSTGLVATRMIPSGLASAIWGTSSRKIAAFFWTRSIRVSPGRWAAPAAMTVIAAPRQSSIGPSHTRAVARERDRVHEVHRLALGLPPVRVDEQDLGREAGQQEPERERRADGAGPDDGDAGRVRRGERVERLRSGHGHTVVHRRPRAPREARPTCAAGSARPGSRQVAREAARTIDGPPGLALRHRHAAEPCEPVVRREELEREPAVPRARSRAACSAGVSPSCRRSDGCSSRSSSSIR